VGESVASQTWRKKGRDEARAGVLICARPCLYLGAFCPVSDATKTQPPRNQPTHTQINSPNSDNTQNLQLHLRLRAAHWVHVFPLGPSQVTTSPAAIASAHLLQGGLLVDTNALEVMLEAGEVVYVCCV